MTTIRRDRDMAYIMEAQNALHELRRYGLLTAGEKATIGAAVDALDKVEQAWIDDAFHAGKDK